MHGPAQKTPAYNRGSEIGAGNETRTRDPDLGKVVLYQLSYSRLEGTRILAMRANLSSRCFVFLFHLLRCLDIIQARPGGLQIEKHGPQGQQR